MTLYCHGILSKSQNTDQEDRCPEVLTFSFPQDVFFITHNYPAPDSATGKIWGYWIGQWILMEKGVEVKKRFNLAFPKV